MYKLTALLGLVLLLFAGPVSAEVSEAEVQALRAQVEALTRRLDELERQRQPAPATATPTGVAEATTVAPAVAATDDAALDLKIDQAVSAKVDEQMASLSWADRLRWKGDFRYRYENIDEQGSDSRNRSRIRARAALEADVAPTLTVGFGLATGGDDPVSANQTLGGGGSKKDINLDLAYFDWTGLAQTHVLGGKFKNFLVRPEDTGMLWDGDWRPEGLGVVWTDGTFFAQGLGTWLEGDSRNGTNFAWIAQGGVNLELGAAGDLMFGGGYGQFGLAGLPPAYGDPDDFFGNSYVEDPLTGQLVYLYDYNEIELFAQWNFALAGRPMALYGDYVVNTAADDNDTGYLAGFQYGNAKARGSWDFGAFYEKLEADAVVGLLTDSDFGGGGTNAKGWALFGTYAFHDNWNFKATYFINTVDLSTDPHDFDRLMLDLNFKYK